MKMCNKCKLVKDESNFYRDRFKIDNLCTICKKCNKQYKLDNQEKFKEYRKRYREQNKEKLKNYNKEYSRKWKERNYNYNKEYRIKNKEKERFRELKYKYGIDKENHNQLLRSQNNVCAICSKPCLIKKFLSIDHCHNTGKIRGLLCSKCNSAIGLLNENIATLQNAIQYLSKENPNVPRLKHGIL